METVQGNRNERPLLSVVIAAYNHSEYIRESIASALAQTYSNFEVVVVDDGSIDGTVDAIQSFGTSVKFIQVDRGGPSACLNAGLRACKGSYIAVTAGDDVCTPDRLVLQLEHALATNADVSFCLPHIIDGASRILPDTDFPVFYALRTEGNIELADLFYNGNYLCASSAFMRTSLLYEVGVFDESLVQLSDYAYWMTNLAKGSRLSLSPHRTTKYRRHYSNLSGPANVPVVQAEIPYLLKKVIDSASPEVLRDAFKKYLAPLTGKQLPLSNFETAVLYFSHDYPAVRSLGLSFYDTALKSGELAALPNFDALGFLINSLKRAEAPVGTEC